MLKFLNYEQDRVESEYLQDLHNETANDRIAALEAQIEALKSAVQELLADRALDSDDGFGVNS